MYLLNGYFYLYENQATISLTELNQKKKNFLMKN